MTASVSTPQAIDLFEQTYEDFVALWAYTCDAGEHGFVHGVFIEMASLVEEAIGGEIDMSELFPEAKEEVSTTLRRDDFQIISVNETTISEAEDRGLVFGFNPVDLWLNFIDEQRLQAEACKTAC